MDFEEEAPDGGPDDKARSRRLAAPGASLYIARRGTPLHVAAAAGRARVAAQLLAAGAVADSTAGAHRCTPLHIAARCGSLALATALLDGGASVGAVDEFGETALHRCCEAGSEAVARL